MPRAAAASSAAPSSPPAAPPTAPARRRLPLPLPLALAFLAAALSALLARVRRPPRRPHPDHDPGPDILLTIYSYDRPAHLLRLLRDADAAAADAHPRHRVAVHVLDDNSLGCVPPGGATPSANTYDAPDADDVDDADGDVDDGADGAGRSLPLSELGGGGGGGGGAAAAAASSCAARARFRDVERFVAARRARGWRLYVAHYRHGRRRHWHLVRMAAALARARAPAAAYYVFLPDDVRLAARFFRRAAAAWDAVADPAKMTLMLHIEASREAGAVWTDLLPERVADGLLRIGWCESGNFIAGPALMRFLHWSFPRVPIARWEDNPPISSGVGATLSEAVHAAGGRMFRTNQSLVAHVGVSVSKMNAAFRDPAVPSHVTVHFADGEPAYARHLANAAPVVASFASTWNRELALHAAVASIAPQVDHVYVYLNGYDAVPAFLRAPFVTALLSSESPRGDLGDVGKFYWANSLLPGAEFHITTDDDIIYPPDYVKVLLACMARYSPPVAVGVHGINIIHDALIPSAPNARARGSGYYGSREVFMAVDAVPEPHNVHILGTGTTMYRIADLGAFDLDAMFPSPNMADIWFGIRAQQLRIPLVTVPHDAGWVREIPGTFQDSIYNRTTTKRGRRRRRRRGDQAQTDAAIAAAPWKHNAPTFIE